MKIYNHIIINIANKLDCEYDIKIDHNIVKNIVLERITEWSEGMCPLNNSMLRIHFLSYSYFIFYHMRNINQPYSNYELEAIDKRFDDKCLSNFIIKLYKNFSKIINEDILESNLAYYGLM